MTVRSVLNICVAVVLAVSWVSLIIGIQPVSSHSPNTDTISESNPPHVVVSNSKHEPDGLTNIHTTVWECVAADRTTCFKNSTALGEK